MRDGVERGESVLRTAVAAGVFTPVVLQMIAVGEESGALDELMDEVADMYQREVEYELKTLSAQIEPILIVLPRRAGADPRARRVPADLGPRRARRRGAAVRAKRPQAFPSSSCSLSLWWSACCWPSPSTAC